MPDWKPQIRQRLAESRLAPARENAIVEELAQDLDDCYAALLAAGVSEAEAIEQTLAELHGSEWLRRELQRVERQYEQEPILLGMNRRTNMLVDFLQDLRFGARMLAKQPGFTLIAVLTLALGIGANITIFSVVNAVLLRPLPYPEAEQLVFLWSESPQRNIKERASAYANVADWRSQSQSFTDIAIFDPTVMTLTGAAEPEPVDIVGASANLFSLLGVAPALGRTFTADDEQQRVVVLSYGLWHRRFGASPDIVGQMVEIDGVRSQVIGVMPESFQFPNQDAQVWRPALVGEAEKTKRDRGFWRVVGRLKAQTTLAQAQTEMNLIAERLARGFPETNKDMGVNVVPFQLQFTGRNVRLALWILFGAVVFVLLIACTNVANLMLARSLAREREMAIRMALGAGRMRLIRQLLTESALLALLAGAVGLFIARFGLQLLVRFSPPNVANLDSVAIDGQALAFAVVVSLLTAALFGLLPAWKVSQSHPGAALKDGRSVSGGLSGLRGLLVVAEFSLAVLLLSGAGLLLRSFLRVQAIDPGFDSTNVLVIGLSPMSNGAAEQIRVFYQQVSERIAALPGVESAGLINDFQTTGSLDALIATERDTANSKEPSRVPLSGDGISGDFFQTLRVPLLKGRFFNTQDHQDAPPVAIINETMARRFWPNEEALGQRFKRGAAQSAAPWLTVVGVVGDMRRQSVERESVAQVFTPHAQGPSRRMNLLIRTTLEPTQLTAVVRKEIRALDKTVPLTQIAALESQFAASGAQRRFQTWLLTLFSALALLLAAVGIFGVMQQSVAQSTREIGVRIAFGAQPRDVLKLVIGQGIVLALCGIGIGWLAAMGLTRVLTGLLFGVTATDPTTFIAAPLLLLLVALLACWIPARRATKVDPLTALRAE
ncbi:MAG: ABC transporter permease [Acidobacteria bacterium]|nr:ABC transporter permease [Acidobacteriota bacterium]